MKKKYIALIVLFIGAVIGLWLLFSQDKTEENQVERSGAGYESMMELGGTLYLAEENGGIYTMDWNTGEKAHVYSAPSTVSWASEPDMSAIYYIDANMLYGVEVSTGQENQLSLPGDGRMEIMAVTEHYVLCRGISGSYENSLLCVNVETGDQYTLIDGAELTNDERFSWEVYAMAGEGDLVYGLFRKNSVVQYPKEAEYWFEVWDLSAGERTFLTETDDTGAFLDHSTTADGLFYYTQGDGLWTVAADGSGAAECVLPKDASYIEAKVVLEDGRVLCATEYWTTSVTKLYIYDPRDGSLEAFLSMEASVSIRGLYTNGSRFALWYWNDGEYILLGDMPSEEPPTVAEQIKAALPALLEPLGVMEEEETAVFSVGQPIKIYRMVNEMLIPGDYDVYPVYRENEMVCLVDAVLTKTGEYTFNCGVGYAQGLEEFLGETHPAEIALIVDSQGIHCVTDTGASKLLDDIYTDLSGKIATLTDEEIEEVLKPFSLDERLA